MPSLPTQTPSSSTPTYGGTYELRTFVSCLLSLSIRECNTSNDAIAAKLSLWLSDSISICLSVFLHCLLYDSCLVSSSPFGYYFSLISIHASGKGSLRVLWDRARFCRIDFLIDDLAIDSIILLSSRIHYFSVLPQGDNFGGDCYVLFGGIVVSCNARTKVMSHTYLVYKLQSLIVSSMQGLSNQVILSFFRQRKSLYHIVQTFITLHITYVYYIHICTVIAGFRPCLCLSVFLSLYIFCPSSRNSCECLRLSRTMENIELNKKKIIFFIYCNNIRCVAAPLRMTSTI